MRRHLLIAGIAIAGIALLRFAVAATRTHPKSPAARLLVMRSPTKRAPAVAPVSAVAAPAEMGARLAELRSERPSNLSSLELWTTRVPGSDQTWAAREYAANRDALERLKPVLAPDEFERHRQALLRPRNE